MGDEYNNDKNKLMDYIEIELKYFNQRMARCELIYYDTNDKFTEWKKEELFHFANELKEKMQSLTMYPLSLHTKEEKNRRTKGDYRSYNFCGDYCIAGFAITYFCNGYCTFGHSIRFVFI